MGVLDLFKLNGKKALVTGAAQGIGKAYAVALAEAGADVAIADINKPLAETAATDIRALGRNSLAIQTDVTNYSDIKRMVETTVKEFGRLDIAVNNAGGIRMYLPEEYLDLTRKYTAEEDWNYGIALGLTSVYLSMLEEAKVMMKQRRGKIINQASISATIVNAGHVYCAQKAGVRHITKSFARDLGPWNINVNCISPGYIPTEGWLRRHKLTGRDAKETIKRTIETTPMGWCGRVEDLMGVVVFLASDASNFIQGQDIIVDGGHTLNVWLRPIERKIPPLREPSDPSWVYE